MYFFLILESQFFFLNSIYKFNTLVAGTRPYHWGTESNASWKCRAICIMTPRLSDETDLMRFGDLTGFISKTFKNFPLCICHPFIVLLKHHHSTFTLIHCLARAFLTFQFLILSVAPKEEDDKNVL